MSSTAEQAAAGITQALRPIVKAEEEPLSANKVIDSLVTALREIEWSNDTKWQSQRANSALWDNHYMPAKERPLATPAPQSPEPPDTLTFCGGDKPVLTREDVEAVSEDNEALLEWLSERGQNAMRIAESKQGEDRAGWLEDAQFFLLAYEGIQQKDAGVNCLADPGECAFNGNCMYSCIAPTIPQAAEPAPVEAVGEDTKRLDWLNGLENMVEVDHTTQRAWMVVEVRLAYRPNGGYPYTLREALDAAIAASPSSAGGA